MAYTIKYCKYSPLWFCLHLLVANYDERLLADFISTPFLLTMPTTARWIAIPLVRATWQSFTTKFTLKQSHDNKHAYCREFSRGQKVYLWVDCWMQKEEWWVKELHDGKKGWSSIDWLILTLHCVSCYCYLLIMPSLNLSLSFCTQ